MTDAPTTAPRKLDKGDEDLGNVVRAAVRNILADPAAATCKRVAWAYGCIRAGSDEEALLFELLRAKLTGATEAAPASPISTASSSSAAMSSASARTADD